MRELLKPIIKDVINPDIYIESDYSLAAVFKEKFLLITFTDYLQVYCNHKLLIKTRFELGHEEQESLIISVKNLILAQEKDENFFTKKEIIEYLLNKSNSTTQIFNETTPIISYNDKMRDLFFLVLVYMTESGYAVQVKAVKEIDSSFVWTDTLEIPYRTSLQTFSTVIRTKMKTG